MFKKINGRSLAWRAGCYPGAARAMRSLHPCAARERVVGWYSTGPRIRECDMQVHELLGQYCETPVLVICEVQPKLMGLPVNAYLAK